MVNMLHEVFYGDNVGSPDTAHDFGPYVTAAAVVRLIRVRASINFAFAGLDLAPTASLVQGIAWGVQAGTPGYTPWVLPAQIGASDFFWAELLASNAAGGASWSPPSADAGWIGYLTAWREWRGQKPIGENFEFHVTTGTILAGSADFSSTFSLEIDYSY